MKLYFTLFAFLMVNIVYAQEEQIENKFDFWVGTWDATWDDGNGQVGTAINIIEKTLDEKVILENFEVLQGSTAGFKGTSISVYNPNTKMWHQAWADNQGGYFNFIGDFDGDKRIFKTIPKIVNEQEIILRMVFYNIKEDSFSWDWERTTDGGKTWQLQWRIKYTRASSEKG